MALERNQNPTCGSTINLRLFTYNSNNRSNVQSIEKVDIFALDSSCANEKNPHGLSLVKFVE